MLYFAKERLPNEYESNYNYFQSEMSNYVLSDVHFLSYFFRESDRDVVAAASSIFIVSSVKVAAQTTELIKSEMHHQLPDQRINALLRFQVC